MQSKSSMFILIVAVILVVGFLAYFFGFRNSDATPDAALVSSNATTAAIPTAGSGSSTGSQVVSILRNLTAISLSDAVFQNPSYGMLIDLSTQLPPATNLGRRNPFAPIGNDSTFAPVTTSTNASTQAQPQSSSAQSSGSQKSSGSSPSGSTGF